MPEQTKVKDAYGMVMAQQLQTQGGGSGGGTGAGGGPAASAGGALIDFSTPAPKTSSNGGGASAASALASIFGSSQTSLSSLNSNISDMSHASEMTARYENPLFGGLPLATRQRRSAVEVAPTWHNGYILIDRKQAERLLLSEGLAHGAFLIRESTTAAGTYALAVRDDEEVQHFRIDEEHGLFSIAGSANKFSALQDLVTFYRQAAGVDGAVPIQLKGSQYGYGYYPVGENADAPTVLNPSKLVIMDCTACLKPIPPGKSFCAHCGVRPAQLTTSTAAGGSGADGAAAAAAAAAGGGGGGAAAGGIGGVQASSPNPGGAAGEDEWELERKDLTMGVVLGAGNFGEVRAAKLKCPWGATIDVAVKMSKANRMTSQAFLAEAAKMKQLRHSNLVLSYGLCTTEDPIFIVFEYMPGGSLLDYLRTRKGKKATLQTCVKFMRDVASAMAFMERNFWVHGDLAARNLLLGAKDLVKLCDFGHAVQTNALDDPVHTDQLLPVKWTSPELYNTRGISSKADVWSFGIVLVEILTKGETPYDIVPFCNNNKKLMAMLIKGWRMPQHPMVASHFHAVLLDCWHPERTERPSFEHLFDHFSKMVTYGKLKEVKSNALFDKLAGGFSDGGPGKKAPGTIVDSRGVEVAPYEVSGLAYEPRPSSEAWLDAEDLMAEWLSKQGSASALPFSSKTIKMVRAALQLDAGCKMGVGVLNNGRHNYISGMHPEGAASKSGKIKPFDALVSINEVDLQALSRMECIAALNAEVKKSPQVVLTLRRDPKLWKDAEEEEEAALKDSSGQRVYDT